MKHLILVLLFLLFNSVLWAEKPVNTYFTTTDTLRFPEDWLGYWSGDLMIYDARGLRQKVEMSLDLAATDQPGRYKWSLIYAGEERPYELITIDAAKGLYQVDEKNTILMESYLINQKLWCSFSVEGTYLLCTYEKVKQKMIFEIMAGNESPVSTTGGQFFEGEDIPVVKTFPVTTSQKAILKRGKRGKKG